MATNVSTTSIRNRLGQEDYAYAPRTQYESERGFDYSQPLQGSPYMSAVTRRLGEQSYTPVMDKQFGITSTTRATGTTKPTGSSAQYLYEMPQYTGERAGAAPGEGQYMYQMPTYDPQAAAQASDKFSGSDIGGGFAMRGSKVDSMDQAARLENGTEFYTTSEMGGVPAGSYHLDVREEGIKEGSDPGTITGEKRIRYYAVDDQGNEYLIKTDNRKASESWDWWDNPLNPLSWFS